MVLSSQDIFKCIKVTYLAIYFIILQIASISTLYCYVFCFTVENFSTSDIVLIVAFTLAFIVQRQHNLKQSKSFSHRKGIVKFIFAFFFYLFGDLDYLLSFWSRRVWDPDGSFQKYLMLNSFNRTPQHLMVIVSMFCLSGDTSSLGFSVAMAIIATFFTMLLFRIDSLCIQDFHIQEMNRKSIINIILEICKQLLHYSTSLALIISNFILVSIFIAYAVPFYLVVACLFSYQIFTHKRLYVQRCLVNVSLYLVSPIYSLFLSVGFDPRSFKYNEYPKSFNEHGKYIFDLFNTYSLVLKSFLVVTFILGLTIGSYDHLENQIGTAWIVILCISSVFSIGIYARHLWIWLNNDQSSNHSVIEAYSKEKLTKLFVQDQQIQEEGTNLMRLNLLKSQLVQPGVNSNIDKQTAIDCVLCGFPGVDEINFGYFVRRYIKEDQSSIVEIKLYNGLEMIKNSIQKYKCVPRIRQLEVLLMNFQEEQELIELLKNCNLMIRIVTQFPSFMTLSKFTSSFNSLVEYIEIPYYQIVAFKNKIAPYQTFNPAIILYDLYD